MAGDVLSSGDVLSFGQQRLWFLDQLAPYQARYLITRTFELTGPLDLAALERALRDVVARHDVLASRIAAREHGPVAVAGDPRSVRLRRIDLSGAADRTQRA